MPNREHKSTFIQVLKESYNLQSNGPVGEQAGIWSLRQLLFTAADSSPHSHGGVCLRALLCTAAAAGDQPGAGLGEPRLRGRQRQQHQQQTRQERGTNAGHEHCLSESHLSCPQSSHFSTMKPPRTRTKLEVWDEWQVVTLGLNFIHSAMNKRHRGRSKTFGSPDFLVSRYIMATWAHNFIGPCGSLIPVCVSNLAYLSDKNSPIKML